MFSFHIGRIAWGRLCQLRKYYFQLQGMSDHWLSSVQVDIIILHNLTRLTSVAKYQWSQKPNQGLQQCSQDSFNYQILRVQKSNIFIYLELRLCQTSEIKKNEVREVSHIDNRELKNGPCVQTEKLSKRNRETELKEMSKNLQDFMRKKNWDFFE